MDFMARILNSLMTLILSKSPQTKIFEIAHTIDFYNKSQGSY